jgi:hypothetical protein
MVQKTYDVFAFLYIEHRNVLYHGNPYKAIRPKEVLHSMDDERELVSFQNTEGKKDCVSAFHVL